MDKMVAAIILIILGVAASVAVAQYMNKQWSSSSKVYDINAASSYISLSQDGTATIMIQLQNVGTTGAYIQQITVQEPSIEIFFANTKAYVAFWPDGAVSEGAVNFSNNKGGLGNAWMYLPAGQSVYMTFTVNGVGNLVTVGDSYAATIYSFSEGKILTFRIVVQSA